MSNSKIEWTEKSWNPIVGCTKVSKGCDNCYAMRMAWRHQHNPKLQEKYSGTVKKMANGEVNWTGKINLLESELIRPLQWKKPSMVFVNSMSDLFHESVPFEFIALVYDTMLVADEHTYQVLTKRPDRMLKFIEWYGYNSSLEGLNVEEYHINFSSAFSHVWHGVSVENQETANNRIPLLLKVPAKIRFLSCEPLISRVSFRWKYVPKNWREEKGSLTQYEILDGIHWVIAGGESGTNARPVHPDWIRTIRDQCAETDIPFFFKQWGEYASEEFQEAYCVVCGCTEYAACPDGCSWLEDEMEDRCSNCEGEPIPEDRPLYFKKVGKKAAGRLLDGVEHSEFPTLQ
jgi:protein gp37